ncbi:MAG: Nif3-like dinuclear metal center hexameric protein [Clostridiales bacterium]|nr:Nif3-like dinuclear metal center hexameric protein [Clostridiales bacterium]
MIKVSEVYDFLNELYPFDKQESWDNSGLLVGNKDNLVNKIVLALDITSQAVEQAEDMGADVIVSHHPVIFQPLKTLMSDSVPFQLACSDISAICVHTPLDNASMGVNDALAKMLRLDNVKILNVKQCEMSPLRIGETQEQSAEEFATFIRTRLGGDVRFNDCGKKIKTVAVCGGSGSCFIDDVANFEIDAFVTGDAGHHNFLDAQEKGLSLFAAGHYETEIWALKILEKKLKDKFDDIDVEIMEQYSPIKNA